MSEKLPEEHQPSSLRDPKSKVREVAYGYGYMCVGADKNFGMFAGPFPNLRDALESVPEENRIANTASVIRFNEDGTEEVLYRWYPIAGIWKRWRPR